MTSKLDRIVHTLLYEGNVLYPYRSSALKNQVPFPYGIVYPPDVTGESSLMQTECVATGNRNTEFSIDVRFLHLSDSQTIERHVGMKTGWMESRSGGFEFGGSTSIQGALEVEFDRCGTAAIRLRVKIVNRSRSVQGLKPAPEAHAFLSTHTILAISGGEFVSSLDPPEEFRDAVRSCRNIGTWPVLAGEPGKSDCVLSSPIILYDYPELAPESTGDFFDATEIDELLTLRVMTLTDDEKREMQTDDRTRHILERIQSLPPEQLMKLHGAIRKRT